MEDRYHGEKVFLDEHVRVCVGGGGGKWSLAKKITCVNEAKAMALPSELQYNQW